MTIWLWLAFLVLVGTLVVVDLGLVTRRPRVVTPLEGLASYFLWLLAAVAFSLMVWFVYEKNWLNLEREVVQSMGPMPRDLDGRSAWMQFMTAFVLESALSLDNIAVIGLLLRHFKIPRELYARTLFWNTLVSLVARLIVILGVAWFFRGFDWFKWVLGGIIVLAMLRTLLLPDEKSDFSRHWAVRLIHGLLPVSAAHVGQKLCVRVETPGGGQRLMLTPILAVVLVTTLMDLAFAVDSVPGLFAVTEDPFLAFSASAFAVLGLRSLYLALSGLLGRFRYLRVSLVFVLMAVAVKMFIDRYDQRDTLITLGAVAGIMGLGVGLSALRNRFSPSKTPEELRPSPLDDLSEAVDVSRRNFRKVLILMAGSIVILVGIAIAPLPGPGPMVLIPIGFAILGTEFVWARRLQLRIKQQAGEFVKRADRVASRTSPWLVPPVVLAFAGAVFASLRYLPFKPLVISMVAMGPAMVIAFWAVKTIRAWRGRNSPPADPPLIPR